MSRKTKNQLCFDCSKIYWSLPGNVTGCYCVYIIQCDYQLYSAVFMQNVIAIVENNWRTGDWNAVGEGYYPLLPYWWHFTRCRSLAVLHTTR